MAHETVEHDLTLTIGLPSIQIPLIGEPTAEELARRQRVIARIGELRKEIGSIGITSDDLLYESRHNEV